MIGQNSVLLLLHPIIDLKVTTVSYFGCLIGQMYLGSYDGFAFRLSDWSDVFTRFRVLPGLQNKSSNRFSPFWKPLFTGPDWAVLLQYVFQTGKRLPAELSWPLLALHSGVGRLIF